MSRFAKIGLILLVVAANLAILCWRYWHEELPTHHNGIQSSALTEAQADTVTAWRNASSVPLTQPAIEAFVAQMSWDKCPISSPAIAADRSGLSSEDQQQLSNAIAGLIQAYGRGDAGALYDYMTSRGAKLSDSSKATLTQLLVRDGGMAAETLEKKSSRELFLLIASKIQYGSHWQALVQDGGCISLWTTKLSRTQVPVQVLLGRQITGLFRNQTRFNQLFERDHDSTAVSKPDEELLFADVQFVVKHDSKLLSEPSMYFVRFAMERTPHEWRPVEMIHVGTISGTSPALLF